MSPVKTAAANEPLSDSDLIDFLLRPDAPDVRKKLPHKKYEIKRLSKLAGGPVVIEVHGLPYGTVKTIQQMPEKEIPVQLIVEGCPFFRNPRLIDLDRSIATPEDAVCAALNAGEIEELSIEVEKLSGYRQTAIAEIKNA